MTKKEQELTKELQRQDLLIQASRELVALQHQRINEIEKLLAKQKRLTDKLLENGMEAFEGVSTYRHIERDLTRKMNKQLKDLGIS